MKKLLRVWLICFPVLAEAQFAYVINQDIPVKDADNKTLLLPWAGGLNSAQYNTLDINGDNKEDLILFDRSADKLITLINENDHYRYAPEYESLFPEMTRWILLRDYNCDGKKDIFTGDALGIKVFTNTTPPGGPLQWEQFFFFTQAGNPKSPVLLTKGFSGKINLQLQFDDLPSISDMDGDGDLDILSMRYAGDITVEYHKNVSVENNEPCDSLDFERISQSWGDFIECECGNFAFHGTECPPASGGRIKHAGGKALLAIDIDHDGDEDILFSEAECNELFLLKNEGDPITPDFSNTETFPSQDPVNLTVFPAPYYEDVDFDGVKDFIITPNLYTKTLFETDFKESNWLYKNLGTSLQPDLSFVKKGFLQDQMIDVGDNAVPAFADVDGDGDMDMFIGQNTGENTYGSIYLYENIGGYAAPEFRLVTDDYLTISSLFFYNVKPQFTDSNGDGKTDLVISATSFITGETKLYAILNKTRSGLDFSGQTFNEIFDMLYSENAHVTDVDLDGLSDILVGRSNGTISLWKNNGPKGSFNYSLANDHFLNLGPSADFQNLSLTSGDLNADGNADLVIGTIYGKVGIINNYRGSTDQEPNLITNIVFDTLTETYTSKNLGGRIWPAVANLYNANKPCIITGNVLGGLHVLRNNSETTLPAEHVIKIFPNPVKRTETLNIETDRLVTVQLVSLLGEELTQPLLIQPNQIYPLSLPKLAAGLYLLRISYNNRTYARRIIIY